MGVGYHINLVTSIEKFLKSILPGAIYQTITNNEKGLPARKWRQYSKTNVKKEIKP